MPSKKKAEPKDEKSKAQTYTPAKRIAYDKVHGKEVDLPALEYWSPEKKGDTIIGMLSRKVQSKKFSGYFYVLDVSEEGEDQHDVGLPSHVLLNRRLDQVKPDSIIAIRFEAKASKDASSYDYSVKVIF